MGINVPFTEADASVVTDGGARKNARAGKGEDAEQKQGGLECRRAGEAVQGGKNGIVAQFILNQMNEISDHKGLLPDFCYNL